MPDCRTGLYRELVVEPERAAAPVIELRDPAPDRSQVWGWCGVLPDAIEAIAAENWRMVVPTHTSQNWRGFDELDR